MNRQEVGSRNKTLRIQVCPKNPGLSRSIPILFGWDWDPKIPIRSGGVKGFLGKKDKAFFVEIQSPPENGSMEPKYLSEEVIGHLNHNLSI